jgi:hypothetical protein
LDWLVSILAGVLAAPVGFVLGTAVAYGLLTLRHVSEREGRRGFLAGLVGGPIGLVAGFLAAFRCAWWLRGGGGGTTRSLLFGALLGIPGGLLVGALAFVAGYHLAEARGLGNLGAERGVWSLFRVALPAAVLTTIGGFLLGWQLTT